MGSVSPTQNAGPNCLDLREVIQVVSGVVHGDIPDRLCPALGMYADEFIVREVGNQFPGATKGSAAASIS